MCLAPSSASESLPSGETPACSRDSRHYLPGRSAGSRSGNGAPAATVGYLCDAAYRGVVLCAAPRQQKSNLAVPQTIVSKEKHVAHNPQQNPAHQVAETVQTSGRATSDAAKRAGEFAAGTTRQIGEAGADAVNRSGQAGSDGIRQGTQH